MYFLAHVAQTAGKQQFHLRVHVLDVVFNDKLAALAQGVDVAELGKKGVELFLGKQSDAFEHGDMSHGAQHVVGCQVEVKFAVAAHGEAVYLGVHLYVLFPEFIGHR